MPRVRASDGPDSTTFCPIQRSSPPLGWIRPYITFTRVDLPAPFSPNNAWISAGYRSRSTPSLARKSPYRLLIEMALSRGPDREEPACDDASSMKSPRLPCVLRGFLPVSLQGSFHYRTDLQPRLAGIIRQNRREQKVGGEENCLKRRQGGELAQVAPVLPFWICRGSGQGGAPH